MDKILTFETYTDRGIFLYTLGEGRDQGFLTKTAAVDYHPNIANYIENAQKEEGVIQVLLTALGSGEFWGSNVNGDFFPTPSLRHDGEDYGHKTFETMAHVYKHHINKDPLKSYGSVRLSVWNEKMKRVELIVTIEESKAPDLVERINNGEYPEVSMGCKVPYDVCSICANKAKTRAQYCDHLRYYMNKIPPGHTKKAYAINTLPKFFDISFVLIGADRIAKVMKKVAHTHPRFGLSSAEIAEKQASVANHISRSSLINDKFSSKFSKTAFGLSGHKLAQRKMAEIEKDVPSNLDGATVGTINQIASEGAEALRPFEKDIPKTVIIQISNSNPRMEGLSKILSTLMFMGITPKRKEFQDIALRCLGKGHLADEYERLGITFDPNTKVDPVQQCACNKHMNISDRNFNSETFQATKPLLEERSYARPLLAKRVIRLVKLAEDGKLQYPNDEHVKIASEEESSKIGLLPMMLTLTGLYVALKGKGADESVKGIDKVLSSHPALAAALGIGAVAGFNSLTKRSVKGKFDFNPDGSPLTVGSWQDEIHNKNMNPVVKTGEDLTKTSNAAGSIGKRLFFGVPALYMLSGMQEVKKARNPGEQESAVGSFVRKHPDIASAALVGEGLAGFPATKKFKSLFSSGAANKVSKGGLDLLRKMGSVTDEAVSTAIFSLAFPGSSTAVRAATAAVDYGIIKGVSRLLENKKAHGGKHAKY